MRSLSLVTVTLLVALSAGSGARAQSTAEDQAKAQYQQGIELFEAGRFEQAAIAFRKAYELRPSYRVLFNVAQAENNANRFAAALWAYTKYLADGGNEIPQQRVDQVKEEIKRLNTLVGMLVIRNGPDDAEVFVDRESHGKMTQVTTVFVDLGRREVVVNHGGKRILEQVVTVAGGERVVLDLEMQPAVETGRDEEAEKTETKPEPALVEEEPPKPKRLWTWVAAGVGGAALIGTVITGSMAVSQADDVKSQCDGNECPPSVESDLDSTRTLGNVATALTVVTGVGLAAAVVLFFVEPGLGETAPSATVGVTPLPGGAAMSFRGRF